MNWGGEPGVRQTFGLNPWTASGMTQKEVMVASIDLRELDAVPTQVRLLLNECAYVKESENGLAGAPDLLSPNS